MEIIPISEDYCEDLNEVTHIKFSTRCLAGDERPRLMKNSYHHHYYYFHDYCYAICQSDISTWISTLACLKLKSSFPHTPAPPVRSVSISGKSTLSIAPVRNLGVVLKSLTSSYLTNLLALPPKYIDNSTTSTTSSDP